ncbi:hypothetical protein SFUMM280S_09427 [Streptomyces fumanus]
MHVRDLVLRADGQFLQHELEVVVPGEGDDLGLGVGLGDAERGGHVQPSGPAWPQLIQCRGR